MRGPRKHPAEGLRVARRWHDPYGTYTTGTVERALRSFSHEFVHVAQMVRGALERTESTVRWKDMPAGVAEADFQFYESLPWEVEAGALGAAVYERVRRLVTK